MLNRQEGRTLPYAPPGLGRTCYLGRYQLLAPQKKERFGLVPGKERV